MHLADEMLDHFFRHLKVGNDAVAQRSDRLNVARGAAEHQLCFFADGEDLFSAADAGDRYHGWLVQHDPPAFHVDQSVCGAEIDRHIGREQTQHSSNHLTANPKPQVIPMSDSAPGCPRESCPRPTIRPLFMHRAPNDRPRLECPAASSSPEVITRSLRITPTFASRQSGGGWTHRISTAQSTTCQEA